MRVQEPLSYKGASILRNIKLRRRLESQLSVLFKNSNLRALRPCNIFQVMNDAETWSQVSEARRGVFASSGGFSQVRSSSFLVRKNTRILPSELNKWLERLWSRFLKLEALATLSEWRGKAHLCREAYGIWVTSSKAALSGMKLKFNLKNKILSNLPNGSPTSSSGKDLYKKTPTLFPVSLPAIFPEKSVLGRSEC